MAVNIGLVVVEQAVLKTVELQQLLMEVLMVPVDIFLVDHMQAAGNPALVTYQTTGIQVILLPCIWENQELQTLAVAVDVDGGCLEDTAVKVAMVDQVWFSLHIPSDK